MTINIKAIHENLVQNETKGRKTSGFSIPLNDYEEFVKNAKKLNVSRSKYVNAFLEDFMEDPTKITLSMLEYTKRRKQTRKPQGFSLRDIFDDFSEHIARRRKKLTAEERPLYSASSIVSYYIIQFNKWIDNGGASE